MKILLSSRSTPFFKFALPAMGFSAVFTIMILAAPVNGILYSIGVVIAVAALLWSQRSPLKRIIVETDHLNISNYFTEYRVPLSAVKRIDWDPDRIDGCLIAKIYIEERNSDTWKVVRFIATSQQIDDTAAERMLLSFKSALRLGPQEYSDERKQLNSNHYINPGSSDDSASWSILTAFGGVFALIFPFIFLFLYTQKYEVKEFLPIPLYIAGGITALTVVLYIFYAIYVTVSSPNPKKCIICLGLEIGRYNSYKKHC